SIEMMSEAMTLARAQGVSAQDFLEIMTGTLFTAPVFKSYGALIAERRYSPPGFKLRLGEKDVNLVLAAAGEAAAPMPIASMLRDNFLHALAHGDGDLDWSALAKVAVRRAHFESRQK